MYKLYNINRMTVNINSDRCNMTNDYYIQHPMPAIELKLNMILAKNPHSINSLDQNKNRSLIRKYLHVPFIN